MNQQIPDPEGISSSLPSKDTPSSRRPDLLKQTPEVHQTINCPSVPRPLTPHQQGSSTGRAAANCCRRQRLGRGRHGECRWKQVLQGTVINTRTRLRAGGWHQPQACTGCIQQWEQLPRALENCLPDILNYTWVIGAVVKSLIPLTHQIQTQN